MTMLQAFWRDTRAATSIEYAAIAALVSIVIAGSLTTIGIKLKTKMDPINTGLS